MYSTELFIREYLNFLRPVPAIETDSVCPPCLETYPAYSNSDNTDYAAARTVRPLFSRCRHVFGRLCIERHIRGGKGYSTRCPIYRERWLGPWQPSSEDAFELDGDPLSATMARRAQQQADDRSDDRETFAWDSARDMYTGFEDVFKDVRYTEDGPSCVVATASLQPLIGWLRDLQAMHNLEHIEEEELNCILDALHAVNRLRRKLDARAVREP